MLAQQGLHCMWPCAAACCQAQVLKALMDLELKLKKKTLRDSDITDGKTNVMELQRRLERGGLDCLNGEM